MKYRKRSIISTIAKGCDKNGGRKGKAAVHKGVRQGFNLSY